MKQGSIHDDTGSKMPIREMSQNEMCHTDELAQYVIKTPLRQNATLKNCHKTKRHFDTPL